MLATQSSILRTGMLVQIEETGQVGRIANFHGENPFFPFDEGEFVYIVALDGTWSEYATTEELIILEWDTEFHHGDEIWAHMCEEEFFGVVTYTDGDLIQADFEDIGLRSVFNSQITWHQPARNAVAKVSA